MSGFLWAGVAALTGTAALVLGVLWLRGRLRIVSVYGESMQPTLSPGTRLLVQRVPLERVRAGDIVVVEHPHLEEFPPPMAAELRWMVKRAVALPGDPVPESVAPALSVPPGSPVRAGNLIVLGDNQNASYDSRACGYIPGNALLGVMRRRVT